MPVPTMYTSLTPLEREAIVHLDWPARSSDLNSVEHAWDILHRAISARPVQPRTVQELKYAFVAEWRLFSQTGYSL